MTDTISAQAVAWVSHHGMSSATYQKKFDQYVAQGFRLVWVDGYAVGGQDRYAAIWDKSPSGAWVAHHGMNSATYQAKFDQYVGQGYRLLLVSGYGVAGQDRYAALWQKSPSGAWVAHHGMSSAGYQAKFDEYTGKGYRLRHVSGYDVGGSDRYAAIWDKNPTTAWVAHHGMSSAGYQAKFDEYTGKGYRLVLVSGYEKGGQDRYAALWRK